jgi:hypothetical protein
MITPTTNRPRKRGSSTYSTIVPGTLPSYPQSPQGTLQTSESVPFRSKQPRAQPTAAQQSALKQQSPACAGLHQIAARHRNSKFNGLLTASRADTTSAGELSSLNLAARSFWPSPPWKLACAPLLAHFGFPVSIHRRTVVIPALPWRLSLPRVPLRFSMGVAFAPSSVCGQGPQGFYRWSLRASLACA